MENMNNIEAIAEVRNVESIFIQENGVMAHTFLTGWDGVEHEIKGTSEVAVELNEHLRNAYGFTLEAFDSVEDEDADLDAVDELILVILKRLANADDAKAMQVIGGFFDGYARAAREGEKAEYVFEDGSWVRSENESE